MKQKEYIIHWVHPFQTAKIVSVITGIVGVLFGVLTYVTYAFFLYSSKLPGAGEKGSVDLPPVQNIEPAGLILVFILYLVAGFFIGYVGAVVYNMLAKKIGGIEVRLNELKNQE